MDKSPYQSLVSLLSNVLEAYTTAFFIVDPRTRQLNLAASQSLSRHLPQVVSLPLEQSGILGQVQKVGQTIHLEKLPEVTSALSTTVPFYREGEAHIKGLFAVPVGDGAGVLYVDTKYGWGFNDKQQKWIKEVAAVLQEIMQHYEYLRQQQDTARILGFWRRLDEAAFKDLPPEDYCAMLVNESAELLEAEYAFLALREAQKPFYHLFASTPNCPRNLLNQPFPVDKGLIGWVFRKQKTVLVTKLNPETSEHFVFSPSEGLPHQGTLWGLPSQMALGHTLVLSFLSRHPREWSVDYQLAISHVLHFFNLYLEKSAFQEEYEHLRTYELSTNLFNRYAFEMKVDGVLASCMQESTPFTLALLQVEPWRTVCTRLSPKVTRRWQREAAAVMCEELPPDVMVGLVTENRFGFLFPEVSSQDAKHVLSRLVEVARVFFAPRMRGIRVHPYIGSVSYPQDGTRTEELWPQVYRRLYSSLPTKD
jgi:GGDEF domain-containing protein